MIPRYGQKMLVAVPIVLSPPTFLAKPCHLGYAPLNR